MPQVTNGGTSGHPAAGLDSSRSHHFRRKAQGLRSQHSRWHSLRPESPQTRGAKLRQRVKCRAAPGDSGGRHQRRLGGVSGLAGEATGQPDCETVSLFPGPWAGSWLGPAWGPLRRPCLSPVSGWSHHKGWGIQGAGLGATQADVQQRPLLEKVKDNPTR